MHDIMCDIAGIIAPNFASVNKPLCTANQAYRGQHWKGELNQVSWFLQFLKGWILALPLLEASVIHLVYKRVLLGVGKKNN